MSPKKDVLVVGAGPAGVSAAFFIKFLDKNNQFNVTLAEKLPWSRYQVYHRMCGEAISRLAFDELAPIKPVEVIEKIKKIQEVYPGGIKIQTQSQGFVLNRAHFLKKYISEFEKLGGNFVNDSIINVVLIKGKVLVNFKENGQKIFNYLVAADGASSTLRRMFLEDSILIKPFVQYLVHKKVPHDVLTFIYDQKYRGDYSWIFPNGNNTKIGFPIIDGVPFEVEEKIIKKQVRLIAFGGLNSLSKGNIVFVGDSACQTNLITKGGIRPAMVAGRIAAKAILELNPTLYEQSWKLTPFASKLPAIAFACLKKMDNKKLEIFAKKILSNKISKKESFLFDSFELCNKYGW
jgi:flavin-dependent dehydrogenase